MLLGGLWHGAGWNFLIWGGLHGLYLSINHLWQAGAARGERPAGKGSQRDRTAGFAKIARASLGRSRFSPSSSPGCSSAPGRWPARGRCWAACSDLRRGSSAYASPGILRLMDLPILVGEERLLLIGGGAVALALASRAWPAQCSADLRLSRISPRAGADELAAMAAERGVGAVVGARRLRSRCSACGSGWNFCIFSFECVVVAAVCAC